MGGHVKVQYNMEGRDIIYICRLRGEGLGGDGMVVRYGELAVGCGDVVRCGDVVAA